MELELSDFSLPLGDRQRADPRPRAGHAARCHAPSRHPRRRRRGERRRAKDPAGAAEPPVERDQVHAGRRPDRGDGRPRGWGGGRVGQRHRRRHRAGGSRGGVRGIPSGRERAPRSRRAPASAWPCAGNSSSCTAARSGSRARSGRARRSRSVSRSGSSHVSPLIECHAHVLPDAVLARFPGGSSPRYVTAERRVLGRMLEAHDAHGVTHAIVSDSFFMETAAEELPAWPPTDRARFYNDHLAALIARHGGRLVGLGCVDPFAGEAAAREPRAHGPEAGVRRRARESVGRLALSRRCCMRAAPVGGRAAGAAALRASHPGSARGGALRGLRPLADRGAPDADGGVRGAAHLHRGAGSASGAPAAVWPTAAVSCPTWRGDSTQRGLPIDRTGGTAPTCSSKPPSSYLRRFHTDTNVWSLPALELLLGVLGPDRLLVGNDQPPVWFPLGESLALLERLALSPAEREAVHWRNAARLFGFVPAA